MVLRRNTKKLVKLVSTVLGLIVTGTLVLKFVDFNADLNFEVAARGSPNSAKFGLPRAPEILRRIKKEESEVEENEVENENAGKKDWHNAEQIDEEVERKGAGEQGAAYYVPATLQKKKDELYKVNGFNALASDAIALNRSLPDIRNSGCKSKMYLAELPVASVVVPFHNEHWTTLLRTVISVMNRAPQQLLKEIILVDDFSTKDFLKKPLEDYVRKLKIVKIVRANKREGLIRARLLGAKKATGDVIIFLDSHTEANVNWLPPLLALSSRQFILRGLAFRGEKKEKVDRSEASLWSPLRSAPKIIS